jgi:hypothetical protein
LNPNVTIKDIITHVDKPWERYWVFQNTSIVFRDVVNYPDLPWDWYALSVNKFNKS